MGTKFDTYGQAGLAAPPEAVFVGEDVPRGNETDELFVTIVEQIIGWLKAHLAYRGRSKSELWDIVVETTKRLQIESRPDRPLAARSGR